MVQQLEYRWIWMRHSYTEKRDTGVWLESVNWFPTYNIAKASAYSDLDDFPSGGIRLCIEVRLTNG